MIHGTVSTHIVKVTNTGPLPVSFRAERRFLAGTGWFMQLIAFGCILTQSFSDGVTFTELCKQKWVHIFPGFSTELDRVKNLPYCETETFEVKFDPRGANLELGDTTTVLPIQVGLP